MEVETGATCSSTHT